MKISFKVFLDTLNIVSQFKTPPIHLEIAEWLEKTDKEPRRILMAFRHSGKSYILGAFICWKLLVDPNWTCLLISAKRNLALRNSLFIRNLIENHPMLVHLKPSLYQWKADLLQLNGQSCNLILLSQFLRSGHHLPDFIVAQLLEMIVKPQTTSLLKHNETK